jgi:hypothetical protein
MKNEPFNVSRRHFISTMPCLMIGGSLTNAVPSFAIQTNKDRPLYTEFTLDEQRSVDNSIMARDIENYAGKGYSCAESTLIVSLRYLGKPEEWVDAAACFGGGLRHKDLCGLLTGGMMALGISAGMRHQQRDELKTGAQKLSNKYWDWWTARAPLHCSELRLQYNGIEEYTRMCKRVSLKLEELLKPARS